VYPEQSSLKEPAEQPTDAVVPSEERTHTSLHFYRVTFPLPEDSQAWQPVLGKSTFEELLTTKTKQQLAHSLCYLELHPPCPTTHNSVQGSSRILLYISM